MGAGTPHPSWVPRHHHHTEPLLPDPASRPRTPPPHAPSPDLTSGWASAAPARDLPGGSLPRRSSCQPPPCWQASPGRQPARRAPAATAALPSPAELGAPGSASSSRATSPRLTFCPGQGSGPRTLPSAPPAPNRPEPPQKPGTLRPSLSLFSCPVSMRFFSFSFIFSPFLLNPYTFFTQPLNRAPLLLCGRLGPTPSACARVSVCALGARPLFCLGFPGTSRSGLG